MAIHDGPGRGLKQCGNCGKYVGVRSNSCPACNASFSSVAPVRTVRAIAPTVERKEKPAVVVAVKPTPSKTVSAETYEKGSRIERINMLKRELIKELKNSSRGFSAGIIQEVSDAVLKEWD